MGPNGGYAGHRHNGCRDSAGLFLAMTQLSRHVLETLWEDGDFLLSGSTLPGEPVLAPAPASERPWQRERRTVRIRVE
jgi:hypothetical protein